MDSNRFKWKMVLKIHYSMNSEKILPIKLTGWLTNGKHADEDVVFGSFSGFKTRGPRGPRGSWVAHLGKRSKVTVEPIIENHRGII